MESPGSNDNPSGDSTRVLPGSASHLVDRPLPLRQYGGSEGDVMLDQASQEGHRRRKSTHTPSSLTNLPTRQDEPDLMERPTLTSRGGTPAVDKADSQSGFTLPFEQPKDALPVQMLASCPTPPFTPMGKTKTSQSDGRATVLSYDFSKIDYELEKAKKIGEGLWSKVYLVRLQTQSPTLGPSKRLTPPSTPSSSSAEMPCSMVAVKVAKNASAKKIFYQEARILTTLQQSAESTQYIVPFYGLYDRTSSPRLVFEGIQGANGRSPSLDDVVNSWSTMTEPERRLEMRAVFLQAARDLIDGLRFIHEAGVVHADIKAANVLLDVNDTGSIRARYIDFSASFLQSESASNAGGTWDFMAPEQISSDKRKSKPTFASDIWSLGITLLFILLGKSPYAASCGVDSSKVMWRVRDGTPIQDAQLDPIAVQRIKASQDFVDCCNKALKKNREIRMSAAAWLGWFEKTFPRG